MSDTPLTSKTLVEKLRKFYAEVVECDEGHESGQMKMTREAADEIERLQLRTNELEQQISRMVDVHFERTTEPPADNFEEWRDATAARIAYEITPPVFDSRLLAALEGIVKLEGRHGLTIAQDLARSAIAGHISAVRDAETKSARCATQDHIWVGTGDNRVVCDDCGIEQSKAEDQP